MELLGVGLAGFFGAVARYTVGGLVNSVVEPDRFPWATLAVNITGSFLIGFLFAMAAWKLALAPRLQIVIGVGFIGSYTTFSTFSLETMEMLNAGNWPGAGTNIIANIMTCLVAVYLGSAAGRLLAG